jgi:hypothetical protein
MLTLLLQAIAVTIILNSILYSILTYRGYRIHHKYWLVEKEDIWRDQLDDHYEDLYNDEFETLFEREDNLKSDYSFIKNELHKANRDLKKVHLKLFHFFDLLIRDSKSEDFLMRNKTPKEIIHHYNKSLTVVLECIEKEMDLKPCMESKFIKRIFEDSQVEDVQKTNKIG